jgi:hypothetical protein
MAEGDAEDGVRDVLSVYDKITQGQGASCQTVSAEQTNSSGNLTVAWDATSGQDNDVLHLTTTAVKTTMFGAAGFSVTSTDRNDTHKWYGLAQFQ